jgi:hypothetical protein
MAAVTRPDGTGVDLLWIPVGAGARVVRASAKAYKTPSAAVQHRHRHDLYHAAVQVVADGDSYVIELVPVPDRNGSCRGVVAEGPVALRRLGRLRLFRFEVRCWRGGVIPDASYAADGPRRVTTDPVLAHRILDLVPRVPTLIWGRDELGAGEMWNSNSVIAWLLASAGVDVNAVGPPAGGRAPGWDAGLAAAHRDCASGAPEPGHRRPDGRRARIAHHSPA